MKMWLDQSGRLHDNQGRFTSKKARLTQAEYESLLARPYFYQDEQKPNTYNRGGVEVEVDNDPFVYMVILPIAVYLLYKTVTYLIF